MKLFGSSGSRIKGDKEKNRAVGTAPRDSGYSESWDRGDQSKPAAVSLADRGEQRKREFSPDPPVARGSSYKPSAGAHYSKDQFHQYSELMMAEEDDLSYYSLENTRRRNKKKKLKRRLITLGSFVTVMALGYCICVFSSIPFIKKYRGIYIETAMNTMSHNWLATYFIPRYIIDDVLQDLRDLETAQDALEDSVWDTASVGTIIIPPIIKPVVETPVENDDDPPPDVVPYWEDPWSEFCLTYPEIDMESFGVYATLMGDKIYNEDGELFIDEADVGGEGTTIKTIHGDQVLALDTVHGITIIRLAGKGSKKESAGDFWGVAALIKDPAKVAVATAKRLGSAGQRIAGIAEDNGAILAINASGFEDEGGNGNGGQVYGLLVVNGKKLNGVATDGSYKAIWFDSNDRLNVGKYSLKNDMRDAVEFKPALVVNGKKEVKGRAGWGIHPRSAIGQTADGTVIMMCFDGRQSHTAGIIMEDMADIFIKYGAVQACNLDGGSSAIMYYNGRKITSPSAGNKVDGRLLPDAFVVFADKKAADR